jgi:signal transduction histidine kinase
MKFSLKNQSWRFTLFFWFSFLVVIILNVLVWLYLGQVENRFKLELQNRLLNTGQLMSRLIAEFNEDVDISLLLPDDQSSLGHIFYQQMIDDLRQTNALQSVMLISPQNESVISSPSMLISGHTTAAAATLWFREALSGKTVVPEVQEIAGERFVSAYAPVENMEGLVIAVLVIEARAEYFDVLTNLKNRILLFSSINLVLIALIAMILFQMIRRDIRYQTTLQEREHLVQLGTMAATVAHELRNPLNIIEAASDVIKKKYARNEDEIFTYIPQEVRRLSVMIDDLLKLARTPQLQINPLDLPALANRLRMSLNAADQERFIIAELPELHHFSTDAALLEQALLNVIRNAVQATEKRQTVHLNFHPVKTKQLTIITRDEGQGIAPDILARVFEPFFSTREKGAGLGLAITRRLVRHLGGNISIASAPSKGTTVTLNIPNLRIGVNL